MAKKNTVAPAATSGKPSTEMSNEELLEALEAERAKNAELQKTVVEQDEVVQDLSKAVAAAGKVKQKVVVKHEGKSYQVIPKSFTFDKEIITAESLAKKPNVVKQLVEMESGHLQLMD